MLPTQRRASERRLGVRFVVRALRWRALSAWTLALVSVVAIAASTIGPMFLQASEDSALTAALQQAPPGSTEMSAVTTGGAQDLAHLVSVGARIHQIGPGDWFQPPVLTIDSHMLYSAPEEVVVADLVARTGICAHVQMVAGACPAAEGEVAVSVRSAQLAQLQVGQRIAIAVPNGSGSLPVEVVGLYDPPATVADDYWNGINYFKFGIQNKGSPPSLDDLIATQSTVLATQPLGATPDLSLEAVLRPGAVRADQIDGLERDVNRLRDSVAHSYNLDLATPVFTVLGDVGAGEDLTATVIAALTIQLVLLALVVLYTSISLSGGERRLEIEIARRRGFTRRSMLGVAVSEPAVVLILALPVGVALGWLLMTSLAPGLFAADTSVRIGPLSVLTALAGFVGGAAASVLASVELWRGATRLGSDTARDRRFALALDAIAVALATAGLIALSATGSLDGSHPDPVAALAPGLIALGGGVVGLRLAEWAIRSRLRPTAFSRRIASFLAIRAITRREPSGLRQLLPLTASVVLMVFAVSVWALATQNRATVAAVQTGADRVVEVSVKPGVDLESAVRQVDPTGNWAMAAARTQSSQSGLLAVDSSRLAKVAAWPAGLSSQSASQVGQYLSPRAPGAVAFRGPSLRATIDASNATFTDLTMTVFNERTQDQATFDFGQLAAGTRTYAVPLGGFCDTTCRIVNLSPMTSPNNATIQGTDLTLEALAVGATSSGALQVQFGAANPASWRALPSDVQVTTGNGTVHVAVPAEDFGQGILLMPADLPDPIPAVVTTEFNSIDGPVPGTNAEPVTGFDGSDITIGGQIHVPVLPELGADAALIDYSFAQLALVSPSQALYQVWLGPSAPDSILSQLEAMGVTPLSTASAAQAQRALNTDAVALAYGFAIIAAVGAAILGLGSAVFGILSAAKRRQSEIRALAAMGVSRSAALRSVLLENAVVVAVALVIGGVAGVVAGQLAAASLPEFAGGTGGIPISHAVPLASVIGLLAGLTVLLAVTTVLATALSVRGQLDGASTEEI